MAKKKKTKRPKKKTSKPVRKTGRVRAKKKIKKMVKPKKKVRKIVKGVAKPKVVKPKIARPPFPDATIHRTKIRVVGIGGGGGSIISEIVSRVKKADFVAANTDNRSLKGLTRRVKRFQFGQSITHGLGTGMNVELGEIAAQADKEKIKKLLEGQDLCVIVACLGGGTGSGATPMFAKISRGLGNLTYGIFTLPFEFEGEKKMETAKESLERIRPYLNAYSFIPNERIFRIIDKNTPLRSALSAINRRLAESLGGLIETIYLPGLINIDFADLKTILAGRGRLTYLNTIEIEESDREGLTKKLISSPLYPYTIKGARSILYNITSGKNLQLSEVSQISKTISESINRKAKIIFGVSQSQKHQDKIKITLLATGCGAKGFFKKSIPTPKPSIIKKIKRKSTRPRVKKKVGRKPPKEKPPKEKPPTKKSKPRPKPAPKVKKKRRIEPKDEKILPKKKTSAVKKSKGKRKKQLKPPPKKIEKKPTPPIVKPSLDEPGKKKNKTPFRPAEGPARQSPSEGGKVRRNALQVRKATEEEEKEILEQEKFWEIPAFLRRKKPQSR
jgi:cell division protein FtsZ